MAGEADTLLGNVCNVMPGWREKDLVGVAEEQQLWR